MRKHDEKKLSKALSKFGRKGGATVAEVAAHVGVSGRTVERWLRMWWDEDPTTVSRIGAGRPIRYRVV